MLITVHTDVVGSLLRPAYLLAAQQDRVTGQISQAEFKQIEDRAVDEAIALQEEMGLDVVTDGEMRRLSFQSQMTEAVEGFGPQDVDAFLWGDWQGDAYEGHHSAMRSPRLGVVGQLTRKRHLSAEEFTYLRRRTTRIPKVTLPSASLWANFWSPHQSSAAYPTLDLFLADVVAILRDEVAELVRLGATYIQIDAPHYPLLLEPKTREFYERQGWTIETWLQQGVELDNAVMQGFPDVTFGFHLCRGHQLNRWRVSGGYDLFAEPIFRQIAADRLLLEYDDIRSGSFEPLRAVPDDKMVVLGLITTKAPRAETVAELKAHVLEASRFVDLERLAISPQCGFAALPGGNKLTPEEQRQKLGLLSETARSIWM